MIDYEPILYRNLQKSDLYDGESVRTFDRKSFFIFCA